MAWMMTLAHSSPLAKQRRESEISENVSKRENMGDEMERVGSIWWIFSQECFLFLLLAVVLAKRKRVMEGQDTNGVQRGC